MNTELWDYMNAKERTTLEKRPTQTKEIQEQYKANRIETKRVFKLVAEMERKARNKHTLKLF